MRYLILVCLFFSSCTYSVILTANAGSGSDLVDETDDVDPVVSPTVSIPEAL